MSLQIILKTPTDAQALPVDVSTIETFPLPGDMLGVAIPMNIVDTVGKQRIVAALNQVEHFDLWAGQWNIPK
jgi:hypothetical protein